MKQRVALNSVKIKCVCYLQVADLKESLKESQKRENVLAHDLRSLTELLKDTQHNLRLSNEKVQHLTVINRFQNQRKISLNYVFQSVDVPAQVRRSPKSARQSVKRNRPEGCKPKVARSQPNQTTKLIRFTTHGL